MAVPITVKIPEPMTAPIPSEVRLSQPRDFFKRFSGSCESVMSWSMSFLRKSCAPNLHLPSVGKNFTLCGRFAQPLRSKRQFRRHLGLLGDDARTHPTADPGKRLIFVPEGLLAKRSTTEFRPVGDSRNAQSVFLHRSPGSLRSACGLRLRLRSR